MSPRLFGPVNLRTEVGRVVLPNPIMTASGTTGHGAAFAPYMDLARLGAVVVKSLAPYPWAGNPAPRLTPTPAGMLNSVGLQGPGVRAWIEKELPRLTERGARVVASIWGQRVEEFADAALQLRGVPGVIAVEVNVSCPNIDDRSRMFAHSPTATAEAVDAASASELPRWAKLSPNTPDLLEVAGAALGAGAEALVLVNTLLGMSIDTSKRAYKLGSGPKGGGLSGPAIRPVAVRAVHDCRAAFPWASIVGVGGIVKGEDAVEMLMAGADAVQVGTASFREPKAAAKVLAGLVRWCRIHDVRDVRLLVSAVHRSGAAPAPAQHVRREWVPSEPLESATPDPARDVDPDRQTDPNEARPGPDKTRDHPNETRTPRPSVGLTDRQDELTGRQNEREL
ncbi:MAG TPA: dihydroorotate dehydrogenase [Acidimicrobiales bacterium]|nr:dihydroorotate dehydrogenase [Acidimicrobiales bacterium]